jgi:hypothetical protein
MAGFYNRVVLARALKVHGPSLFRPASRAQCAEPNRLLLPPVELHREPVQAELAPDKVK